MINYDLIYIIPTKEGNPETETKSKEINQQLKDSGITITRENDWGKKRFAYPIKHNRYGSYFELNISCEPDKIKDIEKILKLTPEIIRYKITKSIPIEKITTRRRAISPERMAEEIKADETTAIEPVKEGLKVKIDLKDIDKKIDEILEEEVK